MKVAGIIEARMGSSRLPGKVMLPFGEEPALGLLLKRVSCADKLDEVIVATTEEKGDLPIIRFCEKIGVKSFRGSENGVMKRVLDTARHCEADLICELMGDSPFSRSKRDKQGDYRVPGEGLRLPIQLLAGEHLPTWVCGSGLPN